MKKLLLIDDNASLRKTLGYFLKKKNFDVAFAQDGEEGLERLESFKPDIVVCDMKMPKMNGTAFIKNMQAKEEYKDVPVVVITAVNSFFGDIEIDNKKIQVVQKPFSLLQFYQVLTQVLDLK